MTRHGRDPAVEAAIAAGDLAELVRLVDRLCDAGEWDTLTELRAAARAAVARGFQLWPAAVHAEYRLALEAPGPWAGAVVVEGAGRFAPGPLPEVAASTHAWGDLGPHVPSGPLRTVTAHERVVRGEDLTAQADLDPLVVDLPPVLAPWEPAYPLAEYHADRADFPAPGSPPLRWRDLPEPGVPVEDPPAERALRDLVDAWVAESNGRADVRAVGGRPGHAVAALGPRRVRAAEVDVATALAHLGWAGASGGAHGRRRGAAAGRFAALWTVAALAGLSDRWPLPHEELGAVAGELEWWLWDAGEPPTGWALRVAVADPVDGVAWALAATDAA